MTDPIEQFSQIFDSAAAAGIAEPTAMALATATRTGIPSVRIVLLKHFDSRGFVFFTNLRSRKAAELEENPHAALVFYWAALDQQIRVEGRIEGVSAEEADSYFESRPRGSRIGAWASRQSQRLASREELEERVAETEKRFEDETVPRPPFWSGFRLVPRRIEFWTGKPNRLHERELFERNAEQEGWSRSYLYP